jgi:hypothetical protein
MTSRIILRDFTRQSTQRTRSKQRTRKTHETVKMLETLQHAVCCHVVRNSTGRRGRTSDERRLAIPYTETYYPVLVYTVAEIRLLV